MDNTEKFRKTVRWSYPCN